MATDRVLLKRAQKGQLGSTAMANVDTEVNRVHRDSFHYRQAAVESNAAATGTEFVVFRAPLACKVIEAYETESANVAADASNFLTLTLAKRTAGGAATTLATLNCNVAQTNWVPLAFTNASNAAVLELAAGDAVTVKTTKTGSGRALPAGALVDVVVEWI